MPAKSGWRSGNDQGVGNARDSLEGTLGHGFYVIPFLRDGSRILTARDVCTVETALVCFPLKKNQGLFVSLPEWIGQSKSELLAYHSSGPKKLLKPRNSGYLARKPNPPSLVVARFVA